MFSDIYGEFPPKKLITVRSSCGIGARQPICHVIRELVRMAWMGSVAALVVVARQHFSPYAGFS
jgi:hypothetical protein